MTFKPTPTQAARHLYRNGCRASELDPSVAIVLIKRARQMFREQGDELEEKRCTQTIREIQQKHGELSHEQ